ncbi:hypothetical protein NBRC110019_23200 [Neptunitalea chrysea]|uniref:DUF2059 domain-containing protein n=1 Tax=Neptunitalea chrysea TaxID=1647581 RepID=A0A9W6B7Y3_9FLAO|nr:DUF2059 domain-containing protein [Neptunitalea chrysea]GLB53280.1 hypothetical protein NBRC110019_23200 [Neptunitalea chrysea]
MKKIIFVLIAFIGLQVSAQTSAKDKAVELFKVNGKATFYSNLYLSNGGDESTSKEKVDMVLDNLAVVYSQYLSAEDMQVMIDFYSTEVGKKIADGSFAREDQSIAVAYEEFSKTEAMKKFVTNAKNIGVQETEIQSDWLGSL